jgi:hypothetical protein
MIGYAAGVIPCCVGAEDNVGYVLIGEQNYWPLLSADHVKGWCCCWGKGDATDPGIEYTAAREGFEESTGAFGSIKFLLDILMDVNAREMIFPGGFLIGFGTLNQKERDYLVDLHAKKLVWTLNPIKREMKRLRWFKITDIRDAILAYQQRDDRNAEVHIHGMDKGQFLRHFFKWDLAQARWDRGALKALCDGEYPFSQTRDRYSEWKQNKWASEADKEKK